MTQPLSEDSFLPLEDFVSQFERDREEDAPRPLAEYLRLFPGHDDELAARYLELKRERTPEHETDPSIIGHYRLLDELGSGGQAVVHLAEDLLIAQRRVAIKILSRSTLMSFGGLERFRREAEVAARLDHPGICPVYEAGVDGDRPYIVMRYVEGTSLAEHLATSARTAMTEGDTPAPQPAVPTAAPSAASGPSRERPTSVPSTRGEIAKLVHLVEKAARALHLAHEAGIIHRDIKPGNIMVSPDHEPVLMDFGLARDTDAQTLTLEGDVFGTPAYMSPEQLGGDHTKIDRRTDVWALGVTLFECLTGRRPFASPTREGLHDAIRRQDPPDVRRVNPAISADLRIVIETALEKDLDRRYRTAGDLAEDLRRVRELEPITARPASAFTRARRWAQRNPALAGSLVGSILFLAVGLAASLVLLDKERSTRQALDQKVAEYDQMSDVALVEDLEAEARTLWPRRPARLAALERWLHRARDLLQRRPQHEAALNELRGRAAPYAVDQRRADAERRREAYPRFFEVLDNERAALAKTDADPLRKEVARLESDPRFSRRFTWQLGNPTDRWRHQVLSQMVEQLRGFDHLIAEVEARARYAERIEALSVTDHEDPWRRCLARLRSDPRYADSPRALAMEPQIGLVPLGIDRDSGLWEFWHVDSGTRPQWEAQAAASDGVSPVLGKVRVSSGSGVVLVLIPGGRFLMGASTDPKARNHDPDANSEDGPVHEVTLEAFFLSKYEVTQAQWLRLMGDNPSRFVAGTTDMLEGKITDLNPVTNVSWEGCRDATLRWGLALPTEAQWEYACRAGSDTVFWCGNDDASIDEARAGNVCDRTVPLSRGWRRSDAVDDGYYLHAPVGSLAANPWGLHDLLGNVWEWCDDPYVSYDVPARPGDGRRSDAPSRYYSRRGGGCRSAPNNCRSANRSPRLPTYRHSALGLRPAKPIE